MANQGHSSSSIRGQWYYITM